MAKYFYSPIKQKILLVLASGAVLSFSRSPAAQIRFLKKLPMAWREIDRATLRRVIKEFRYKRLVDFREEKNGVVRIVLTQLGERYALRYDPENISIPIPARWDKKWRIVVFDIPEKKRLARDTLRKELRKLGFFELQKSTWVFPYDCKNAVDFLAELFEVRNYVRLLIVTDLFPDADLRLRFKLS